MQKIPYIFLLLFTIVYYPSAGIERSGPITYGHILKNDLKVIPHTGRFKGNHAIAKKVAQIYKQRASFFVYD